MLLAGLMLAGRLVLAGSAALAADVNIPDPAAVGTPIVLFQPSTSPAPVKPVRSTAPPPARAGIVTKPLIPPAPVAAKLGPPPAPRPALPIETGLQPLATPPETPQSGNPGPAGTKPPWG